MSVETPLGRLLTALRRVSPRRRRWERFLQDLPLDPDHLPQPLEAPGERDFIICGSPRTGTTLLCGMLYQPPSAVTVMEPWDGMRLPPAALFASLRREIETTGRLGRGRLDVRALQNGGQVEWCREGEISPEVSVNAGYMLGVKWPAYWRYLEFLPHAKFLVCLRDPVGTVGSYKKAGGRLALGLNYDTLFNRTMNRYLERATTDPALRRVLLFEYIHSRLLPHLASANVFVVRYERWFTERERLLEEIGAFLGVRLRTAFPVLRAPKSESVLTDAELALLRQHCRTASLLGYPLDTSSTAPVA